MKQKLKKLAKRPLFRKKHPPVGARPGTLVPHDSAPPPRIRAVSFTSSGVMELESTDPADLAQRVRDDAVLWVEVQGLGDVEQLRRISDAFGVHPLALEDVVNTPQRPKVDTYERHALLIARLMRPEGDGGLHSEQFSLFLGERFVITFCEHHSNFFAPIRTRIDEGKGPIRRSGPDYLAYALIDAVVDGYYPVLEQIGERLDTLEDDLLSGPGPDLLRRVQHAKRELLHVRRALWPLREALNPLVRGDEEVFSAPVRVYLRDCCDHCAQLLDVVESYREITTGLMDVYLSTTSHRQNEVMKVLTIMASIFIPLTFLAGIYGMNFEHMPELHTRWGYPILLSLMALIACVMFAFFYRKGWLRGGGRQGES